MNAEDVKVGMVVYSSLDRKFVKVTAKLRNSKVEVFGYRYHWRVQIRRIRPLTKRERGGTNER